MTSKEKERRRKYQFQMRTIKRRSSRKQWKHVTEDVKQRALLMYQDGVTVEEICHSVGISSGSLQLWRIKASIPPRKPRRHICTETCTEMIRLRTEEGLSYREIGRRFGVTPGSILYRGAHHSLPLAPKGHACTNRCQTIINGYTKMGLTLRELGRILSLSRERIRQVLMIHHVKHSTVAKQTISIRTLLKYLADLPPSEAIVKAISEQHGEAIAETVRSIMEASQEIHTTEGEQHGKASVEGPLEARSAPAAPLPKDQHPG